MLKAGWELKTAHRKSTISGRERSVINIHFSQKKSGKEKHVPAEDVKGTTEEK